jgi:hypothetical protein
MSRFWGFLGECDYAIPESQWPMEHPMPFTEDATKWRDVTWLDGGDAPVSVAQNPFLFTTPSFPVGAPATKPAMVPSSIDFTTQPSPSGNTPASTLPDAPVVPATQPSTTTSATTESSAPTPAAPTTQPAGTEGATTAPGTVQPATPAQ